MIVGKGKLPLWSSPIVLAVHYMAPMTWQIEPEFSPCHSIRATQVTHFPATCQVDPGLVNVPIWGFVSHHLQISVGYYIPKSVGWCETLGHLPTPVDPSRLEGHTTYGEDPARSPFSARIRGGVIQGSGGPSLRPLAPAVINSSQIFAAILANESWWNAWTCQTTVSQTAVTNMFISHGLNPWLNLQC